MSNYSKSKYSEDENTPWSKIYKLISPGSKVLDIGCSSGNFGEVLINEKNCIVDGVELNPKDAVEARKKLRKVYSLNIESDPIDDISDKYDYIYFGDVIEHLVNPANSLKRVKVLLEDGGRVLFSVPNMSHVSVRLMLLSGVF